MLMGQQEPPKQVTDDPKGAQSGGLTEVEQSRSCTQKGVLCQLPSIFRTSTMLSIEV